MKQANLRNKIMSDTRCEHYTVCINLTLTIKSSTVKSPMTCFEPVTADEVRKIIINLPSKTYILGPIPTELVQFC